MELTRERIELFANTSVDCETRIMANQLLTEMDKPKIWDGAPEWATTAKILYSNTDIENNTSIKFSKEYTRELPKSSARRIAEEVGAEKAARNRWNEAAKMCMIDALEAAILRVREERETK